MHKCVINNATKRREGTTTTMLINCEKGKMLGGPRAKPKNSPKFGRRREGKRNLLAQFLILAVFRLFSDIYGMTKDKSLLKILSGYIRRKVSRRC